MSFDKNLEKYIFNACIGPDVEEKSRRNFEESCMLRHALLAFLFLQLPQNDTIPQAYCHTEKDQIMV